MISEIPDRPSRAPVTRAAAALAALLLGLPAGGCGYSFAAGPDRHGGARTVALRVVANDTWRQRFELPLTRQLQQQLPVVAGLTPIGAGAADTVLHVRLGDVRNRSLAGAGVTRDANGQIVVSPVLEGGLDLAVEVELVDGATGAPLRRVRLFDRAEYRIAVGETEDSALEESAFDLARKIALALEDPF